MKSPLFALALLLLPAGFARAQLTGPVAWYESYDLSAGPFDNPGGAAREVYRHVIDLPAAAWLRVHFASTTLGPGDLIAITAYDDGAQIMLDSSILAQWGQTSPYFNGNRLLLQLWAAPGSRGAALRIEKLEAGLPLFAPESICGPSDNRLPSHDPRACRLLSSLTVNGYCSASLIGHSTVVTAGHCLPATNQFVVEFNVPRSVGGTIRHPRPADQYTVNLGTVTSLNGGLGRDWGVFRLLPNPVTGFAAGDVQGFYQIQTSTVAVGAQVRVTGYGIDNQPTLHCIQQNHAGPLRQFATRLDYRVDTQPANSGSPVLIDGNQRFIGVHTHGGCLSSGTTSSNSGTSIGLNAPFRAAALSTVAGANDPAGVVSVAFEGQAGASVGRIMVRNRSNQVQVTRVRLAFENLGPDAIFGSVSSSNPPVGGTLIFSGAGTAELLIDITGFDPGEYFSFRTSVRDSSGAAVPVENLEGGYVFATDAGGSAYVEEIRFIDESSSGSPDADDSDKLRATNPMTRGGLVRLISAGRAGDGVLLFISEMNGIALPGESLMGVALFDPDGTKSWTFPVPLQTWPIVNVGFRSYRFELSPARLVPQELITVAIQ